MASDARFPCSICDRTFKHNSTLKLHLETHSSVKFDCTMCSASYKHSYNLTTHMKTHRTGGDEGEGTRHKCDMCSKSFKNKSYLKSHRQTHNGQAVMEAHGSQYTVNVADVQRPKPWRCEQCCLSFQTKGGLQAHDESNHQNISSEEESSDDDQIIDYPPVPSGIKYCCDEMDCEEKFDNFSTLVVHRQTHLAVNNGETDRFICFHCGKSYAQKFNLYTHLKTHRSDRIKIRAKIYRCEPCQRSFKSQSGFENHNKIDHSNVRLRCKICGKEYTHRECLWRHAFKHMNGFEPYNCNLCEFNARTRETIIRHMEKVHNVDYDKSIQGPKLSFTEVLAHVLDPPEKKPPKPKPEKKWRWSKNLEKEKESNLTKTD